MVGLLTIKLHLRGCGSLKEKRGRLQPLMARFRREYNVSVAEVGSQDSHQEAVMLCAMVNTSRRQLENSLQKAGKWIEGNWPDGDVIQMSIEML